ncbi:hypothetical protein IFM89_006152 [Coptis chinensis]|uniref:Serine-threonine/tyrosine-protein kinase catalytic domain-containing protein n=1 Tax=Coptis chinensis TaxID=261450 RepID=A0A835GXS7_9MAGN|nr:hypothetical protein IFM89_006152 [Coptis chinensis]
MCVQQFFREKCCSPYRDSRSLSFSDHIVKKEVHLFFSEEGQIVYDSLIAEEDKGAACSFSDDEAMFKKSYHPPRRWCYKEGMLLLVYDYMPNGSLNNYLFGGHDKRLSWNERYKILEGVSSALQYLHSENRQKEYLATSATLHQSALPVVRLHKTDIYGFGAVLLAVTCGRRPQTTIVGSRLLVDWVWSVYREGTEATGGIPTEEGAATEEISG